MITFNKFLTKKSVSDGLNSVLTDLSDVFVAVYSQFSLVGSNKVEGYIGAENSTGDEQIAMDVYANNLFIEKLSANSAVALIASEEIDEPIRLQSDGHAYSLAFDPVDGSSIADVNLSVGTVVGIYDGAEVIGKTGRDQICSIIVIYGPALTFLFTLGDGVYEFAYDHDVKTFVLQREKLVLSQNGKIFSPGNIKIVNTDSWYFSLINEFAKNGYALRYSGGMVPDINQIIRKGGGIFMYPGSVDKPEGKLRLLYECNPVAMLIEQAGGKAVFGSGDVLDIEIREYHQRTPIFCGSVKEVQTAESYVTK